MYCLNGIKMKKLLIKRSLSALATCLFALPAFAEVSFSSASNGAVTLHETLTNDDGGNVFVFKGLANGESSDLVFAVDSDCPMIAMTGGAKFTSAWSCSGGVINVSAMYKGGMSFGPGTEDNKDSFYVTFSDPPTPPGSSTVPTALAGIQMSLYGDISKWSLDGKMTSSGMVFGVSMTGTQGGDAHFLMDLPKAAATLLGGVLGVSVGGVADPFASVVTNEDESVSLAVNIDSIQSASIRSGRAGVKSSKAITKKIYAGARTLSVGAKKSSVKSGTALTFAMCAGKTFTKGAKVPLSFLLDSKTKKSLPAVLLTLNAKGCATKQVNIPKLLSGSLVAKVSYKNKTATTKVKVTK